MAAWGRFLVLVAVKVLSRTFFSFQVEWVGGRPKDAFQDTRLCLLLNHTSLFEPLFLAVVPFRWLWQVARRGILPGADVTMERPILGRFLSALVPSAVPITRRRDCTWKGFLEAIEDDALVLIAPEGRMKRRNGLDKHGKRMTVRGGVAEVLEKAASGNLLIFHSGGLHHIQAPGDRFPRLFKRARLRFEQMPVESYKRALHAGSEGFRERVIADLERRRDRYCSWGLESDEAGALPELEAA